MHFRMLQQGNRCRVVPKQFSNNGQDLANAISRINQIALRALYIVSSLSEVYLERIASVYSKSIDDNFIKETRTLAEFFHSHFET